MSQKKNSNEESDWTQGYNRGAADMKEVMANKLLDIAGKRFAAKKDAEAQLVRSLAEELAK